MMLAELIVVIITQYINIQLLFYTPEINIMLYAIICQ